MVVYAYAEKIRGAARTKMYSARHMQHENAAEASLLTTLLQTSPSIGVSAFAYLSSTLAAWNFYHLTNISCRATISHTGEDLRCCAIILAALLIVPWAT